MFNQMQFFRKIKFGSILLSIESFQNIVISGRKWRSRNPEFVESLFGVVRPDAKTLFRACPLFKV